MKTMNKTILTGLTIIAAVSALGLGGTYVAKNATAYTETRTAYAADVTAEEDYNPFRITNIFARQRNTLNEKFDEAMAGVVDFVEENDPEYVELAVSVMTDYKDTVDYTLDSMEKIEEEVMNIAEDEELTNEEKLEMLKEKSGLTEEEWAELLNAAKEIK